MPLVCVYVQSAQSKLGSFVSEDNAATFLCLPSQRTPSTTSDEFQFAGGPRSLELEPFELSSSSSSSLSSASQSKLQPQRSKNKGKSLNPFAVSSSSSSNPPLKGSEANNQIPKNLLQLAKNKGKEGKEKKKKKGKGGSAPTSGRGWRRRRGRVDFLCFSRSVVFKVGATFGEKMRKELLINK